TSGMHRAVENGSAIWLPRARPPAPVGGRGARRAGAGAETAGAVRRRQRLPCQCYGGRCPAMTKHILVVDDRLALLDLLRRLLEEEEQSRVSVLPQGSGAVAQIRAAPPDLLILDLKLADAEGLDILQELRANATTADIPVIVYTAAVREAETV